jgi:hypothetical protein
MATTAYESETSTTDDRSRSSASRDRPGLGEAALKGLLAGLAGGIAMALTARIDTRVLRSPGARVRSTGGMVLDRMTDGAGSLSPAQHTAAGYGLQLGSCAAIGAAYGVVQSRLHAPALLHGALLGGITSFALHSTSGLLPRLGVAAPLTQQSIEEAITAVDTSMAYGITTALVYSALERR